MVTSGPLPGACYDTFPRVQEDAFAFEIRGQVAPVLEIFLPPGKSLTADPRSLLSVSDAGTGVARKVLITSGEPCTIGAYDLRRFGGRLLVPRQAVLAAGPNVTLAAYAQFRSLRSADRPRGLELLLAEGPGWLFARARGDVQPLSLIPGEIICARALGLSALTATVDVDLIDQSELVRLRGPGRVWLQSIPFESDGPARFRPLPEEAAPADLQLRHLSYI